MSKSVASLNKRSISLVKSGATFVTNMQSHVNDIMVYCFRTNADGTRMGDVTPATFLLQQVTRKADRTALISWFGKHCFLSFTGDNPKPGKDGKTAAPNTFKASGLMAKEKGKGYKNQPDFALAEKSIWIDKPEGKEGEGKAAKFDTGKRLASFATAYVTALTEGRVETPMTAAETAAINKLLIRLGGKEAYQIAAIKPETSANSETANQNEKPRKARKAKAA